MAQYQGLLPRLAVLVLTRLLGDSRGLATRGFQRRRRFVFGVSVRTFFSRLGACSQRVAVGRVRGSWAARLPISVLLSVWGTDNQRWRDRSLPGSEARRARKGGGLPRVFRTGFLSGDWRWIGWMCPEGHDPSPLLPYLLASPVTISEARSVVGQLMVGTPLLVARPPSSYAILGRWPLRTGDDRVTPLQRTIFSCPT